MALPLARMLDFAVDSPVHFPPLLSGRVGVRGVVEPPAAVSPIPFFAVCAGG